MNFLALLVMLLPVLALFIIFFLLKKKQKVVARVFLIAGLAGVIFVTALWILELSGSMTDSRFDRISNTLQNGLIMPSDENQQKYLLLGLSNAAEGFANYALSNPEKQAVCVRQLKSIIAFVTDDENYPAASNKRLWKNNIFFLLHLNSILSSYESTLEADSINPLHRDINNFLANKIIQSRYKSAQSFSNDNTYWASDNALILSGLDKFDQLAGTNTVDRPQKDWVNFVFREVSYENSHLPCSAFTDKNKCKEMPHGTHLATMVSSLSRCCPVTTKNIWKKYKQLYKHNKLGIFASFSQYHPEELPPAYKNQTHHPLDAISPDLASLKAAASYGDHLTYFQIANQLWLKEIFNGRGDKKLSPEYRWKKFYKMSLIFSAETAFKL